MYNSHSVSLQIGNFAVWINNDTEYEYNIAEFSKTYKKMADQLPFFIWRDASVQHFSVRTSPFSPPFHCHQLPMGINSPGLLIKHAVCKLARSALLLMIPGMRALCEHACTHLGGCLPVPGLSVHKDREKLLLMGVCVTFRRTLGTTMERPTPSTASLWGARTKKGYPSRPMGAWSLTIPSYR